MNPPGLMNPPIRMLRGLATPLKKEARKGTTASMENRRIINETAATQYCNDFLDFEDFTKYTPAPPHPRSRRDFPQVEYL